VADPEEERRLLYVGITRAKRHLYLSWPLEPRTEPSPFLSELGVRTPGPQTAARPATQPTSGGGGGPLFDELRRWRSERAKDQGVPAYVVFHDATLAAIAERRPRDRAGLAGISGIGPKKLELYGDDVLRILSRPG
jgi:DNA helicase-2/ATP-dependent DNA helicase PcrA